MSEETTPSPIAPVGSPIPPQQTGGTNKKWYLVGALVLVLIAAGAGAWVWYDKQDSRQSMTPTPNPAPTPVPTPTPEPTPTPPGETYDFYASNLPKNVSTGHPEPLVKGEITWVAPKPRQDAAQALTREEGITEIFAVEVGTFKSGKYNGGKLLTVFESSEGPGTFAIYRIVEETDKTWTLLQKQSDEAYQNGTLDGTKVSIDKTYNIPDLDAPSEITTPDGKKLVLAERRFFRARVEFFDRTGLKLFYNDAKVGGVFTTPDGIYWYPESVGVMSEVNYKFRDFGFYVKLPDSSMATYEYIPEILKNDVPDVYWSNGPKNTAKYGFTDVTGCGGSNFASVVNIATSDLVVAGSTYSGQQIFEPKDKNHDLYKRAYEQYWAPDGQKISYDNFVKSHPIFFWRDPFGRLIKFQDQKYMPVAECAKPVIYLYPQKATNVKVKIAPEGGFKITDPAYGNGWNVVAQPDGRLTNKADGKDYPYLFWEGWGGMYESPKKGWVVTQSNLPSFLDAKLKELGLVENEIRDFKKYWLPYMTEKPYYAVSFWGNEAMDQLAPMQVTPRPDTIIRVLMDFTGLDEPIPMQGYTIKPPERKGFTVTEWGGVKKQK